MKAILEYDFTDIDDRKAHLCAVKSEDMAIAIWNLQHNFRKTCESRIDARPMDKYEAMEVVFGMIDEILEGIHSEEYIS